MGCAIPRISADVCNSQHSAWNKAGAQQTGTLNVTVSLERILGRVAGRLGETEALKRPQPKTDRVLLAPSSLPQLSALHSLIETQPTLLGGKMHS